MILRAERKSTSPVLSVCEERSSAMVAILVQAVSTTESPLLVLIDSGPDVK